MSNIYVQEPPTCGKVVITTSLGEIEVELWSKECPKASRNFIQLCMEGYYNNTIFHRVVPNFIAQGGDPTGTGHGGESIYGVPFKNELHSRLRFVRRGLVATANTGSNDNESQFFFTLASCPELQNKHTIFGSVAGNTLYNMIKFNDLDVDREDRPYHPPKITKTEVIHNPFPDVQPRVEQSSVKTDFEKPKSKGKKNLQLLSFHDEEMEECLEVAPPKLVKSSHDLISTPVEPKMDQTDSLDIKGDVEEEVVPVNADESTASDIDELNKFSITEKEQQESRSSLKKIKDEIRNLKRKMRTENASDHTDEIITTKDLDSSIEDGGNDVLASFHHVQKAYKEVKQTLPAKGSQREAETLARLQLFQKKLSVAREDDACTDVAKEDEKSWLSHSLKFEESAPALARDANTKGDDWFEIYDPRNPINKRRREASKQAMKEKGSSSKQAFN